MFGKNYFSSRKNLLSVTPILTSDDCDELDEIKWEKGYEVEFRIIGSKIFVHYSPELRREDMESNGFVLRRIDIVWDRLEALLKN